MSARDTVIIGLVVLILLLAVSRKKKDDTAAAATGDSSATGDVVSSMFVPAADRSGSNLSAFAEVSRSRMGARTDRRNDGEVLF